MMFKQLTFGLIYYMFLFPALSTVSTVPLSSIFSRGRHTNPSSSLSKHGPGLSQPTYNLKTVGLLNLYLCVKMFSFYFQDRGLGLFITRCSFHSLGYGTRS